MRIEVWRAFDFARERPAVDSYNILLDRAWPSRVRKEELHLHEWKRSLAPPRALHDNLREGHMPWPEFKAAYWDYLEQHWEQLQTLIDQATEHCLVLLHGWKDRQKNPATALRDFLLIQAR